MPGRNESAGMRQDMFYAFPFPSSKTQTHIHKHTQMHTNIHLPTADFPC